MMEQHKTYEQVRYNSAEPRNEGLGSANQRYFQDPSSSINTNIRPPDFNVPVGARPVLNYSIQTGEEFALEFMRERVNSRPQLIPNPTGDSNSVTSYTDLKGILGVSHMGSESGSDISMISSMDKGRLHEYERRGSSVHEDKRYYDSTQSVHRALSSNDSNRGTRGSTSSEFTDNLSRKVKFLCSFGGKILPRPSDGKLRYVGGETRIIPISRGISWQELMQKTLSIYSECCTIKYQLPGEDLDALVSVSCDEDLQNMMEECSVLEDGRSQKPRMFLFSSSDLDDSQLALDSMEGDSEIQYVVAVNGMDLGSKKNSICLGSNSANNLDELLNLNVERETGRVADLAATPSSINLPSRPMAPSSSSAYQSNSLPYHGQMADLGGELHTMTTVPSRENLHFIDGKTTVPLQHGYVSHPSTYAPLVQNIVPTPLSGHTTGQEVPAQQTYSGSHVQVPEVSVVDEKIKRENIVQAMNELGKNISQEKPLLPKESRIRRDSSGQKISEQGKILYSENEYIVSPQLHESNVPSYIPRETSNAQFGQDAGASAFPAEKHKKNEEPARRAIFPVALSEASLNKSDENDYFNASGNLFGPGYGELGADSAEFSYHEVPVLPQRVFHSEWIPREQAGLNRLSKSEDSFDPQVLISHARSDLSQQVGESVDKLHDGIATPQMELSISSLKPLPTNPLTVEDESAQSHKHDEAVSYVEKINSKFSGETFEPDFKKSVLKPMVVMPVDGHEVAQVGNSYRDQSNIDKETSAVTRPVVSRGPSGKRLEDSASRIPESPQTEVSVKQNHQNNIKGHGQSFPDVENPARGSSHGESAHGGTPEQGDILIDINDRFPPEFLSDIFKARISVNLPGISPLPSDGTGLSLNMENHEPKRWSFFQKLVQGDFDRNDVSLMDQDHLGFSSPLTDVQERAPVDYGFPTQNTGVALSHIDSHIGYDVSFQPQSSGVVRPNTIDLHSNRSPQINNEESLLLDGPENSRATESNAKGEKLEAEHPGPPLVDVSLKEFDLSTLQIIKNEDLEELGELGSGTFGTVYHGKWRGTDVAIKRIKKSCFAGRSSEQERLTLEFWREAEILSKLHHPNVVAFYGVVQDGPGGTLATVTEYMVNGSLRHVLLCKDRQLDRRKRLIIAMDAAFGMEYLHSKNIVHFDLKCDNLLVNLKDTLRPICKVGDFGLSKIKRNTLVTGGVRGTLPWMAPELLNGSSSKVSEKVDVFSFGIVLWEILTGEEPYANMHYGAIIGGIVSNTLRPPVPSFCDPEWKLLMEQCWAPDPIARPSFTEIARRLRVMSDACQMKPSGHHAQTKVTK